MEGEDRLALRSERTGSVLYRALSVGAGRVRAVGRNDRSEVGVRDGRARCAGAQLERGVWRGC